MELLVTGKKPKRSVGQTQGKSAAGSGSSRCKGPEAGGAWIV